MSRKQTPKEVLVRPGQCPVDGGIMYEYGTSLYCPAEDPHPGGLLIEADGMIRMWSIASGGRIPSSPKRGGPKA